ncbi:MAG: EVE domain-containing protein [Alphaproteobacteria bacterium]|nr:EVE domain-containing protein [Alphaproteobacteria bacterium]MDA7982635.1 EVE domain-containing protein [Alphaproteobacteria bacterium]MDA7988317.1 EVE domain-containing protein [Alphaproteobacteria bacterium]MDA7999824.1 EVE domain-containing protein [Alphaproteobacteria bacterium]MDA8003563.1 EVE domain-containing protein [Alphaproteobacteria bacterium]
MAYWLVKSEPEDYSWQDLLRERRALWDGVRNAAARNNLARMRVGDRVFFYHSGGPREIVGIAKVVRAALPDPADGRWLAVEIAPAKTLSRPVALSELRGDGRAARMVLLRQPRLSVQPVGVSHWRLVLERGEGTK